MKKIKLQNQAGRELEAFVTDCGRLFLPASLFGNQEQILYCCGYDGTETVQDGGRIYAPGDWLATEFPEHEEQIKKLMNSTEGKR